MVPFSIFCEPALPYLWGGLHDTCFTRAFITYGRESKNIYRIVVINEYNSEHEEIDQNQIHGEMYI